jgi:hypothetical protein
MVYSFAQDLESLFLNRAACYQAEAFQWGKSQMYHAERCLETCAKLAELYYEYAGQARRGEPIRYRGISA